MSVVLKKAGLADAERLHGMQVESFMPLLLKYQDNEMSPAMEPLEKLRDKIEQPHSCFYLIERGHRVAGGLRVVDLPERGLCRISPLFILPDFQKQGIAQAAMRLVERLHQPRHGWRLDTILEEPGNCHLYEKLGYARMGPARAIKPDMHLIAYGKAR
ncbi:GNAT family N-acetyltransferase [Chromobacterium phragmitis]|uniref:GNAT family N-acetyltransferase n=1 Tax=Chromobacterium phragmitis TaxID=2202141 RepID=A0A344UIY0_9NEIS|nr:GNAT family N-acetyltransferase [Chromobacterium phragmitis]AXE29837.1 GNAT family N-acetyltransferase [Chromobacterium phragmitis]AXE35228.1 GNAT family N-acetyltransferase [Chromobacterium phragmitis]